jgi:hypothetical protein
MDPNFYEGSLSVKIFRKKLCGVKSGRLLCLKGFYTFFKPTGSRFVPSKTDEIKK